MVKRRIEVLEGLLTIGLFGMAGAGIYYLIATVYIAFPVLGGRDFGVTLPYWGAPGPLREVVTPGVLAMDGHLEVTIRDTGVGVLGGFLYVLTWAPGVVTGLLALWWLNRQVIGARAVVPGLRRIGWVMVGGSLAAYVLGSFGRSLLAQLVFAEGSGFAPSPFSVATLLGGLGALAIAECLCLAGLSGLSEGGYGGGDQRRDQQGREQVTNGELLHP